MGKFGSFFKDNSGGLIGGALKLGGNIFAGIKASKAIQAVKDNLSKQMKDNQNWYDRRYNEDSTQRSDAQHILNIMNEQFKARNKSAAGTQAVMGGTDEAMAATRTASNQALSDAATRIAIAGEARKDNIENQYMTTKSALNSELNDLEQKKAASIAEAAKGVADAGANLGKLF